MKTLRTSLRRDTGKEVRERCLVEGHVGDHKEVLQGAFLFRNEQVSFKRVILFKKKNRVMEFVESEPECTDVKQKP